MDTYPISEIFTSQQGEGVYASQMQTFIRLAGCTVGRKYPKNMYEFETMQVGPGLRDVVHNNPLPIYTEECTLWDGRKFSCDTDYRRKAQMSVEDIVAQVPANVYDVCITGGEPLMHDLDDLFSGLSDRKIHIETSGTINRFLHPDIWVTVAPKFMVLDSMLERANEIKLLVSEGFRVTRNYLELAAWTPVFLQPVNFENDINKDNVKRCMEIQNKYPQFRLSLQLHKILSQCVGELVR